jgi:hypothetical protein
LSIKAYFGQWQTALNNGGGPGAICEIFATLGKSFGSDTLQIGFPALCANLQTEEARSMTTKSFLSDPEHWRTPAEEARRLAQDIKDANTTEALLQIADEYHQLAHRVEDWVLRHLPKH